MLYKHRLKYLGILYSFIKDINNKPFGVWCDKVNSPSAKICKQLEPQILLAYYQKANALMEKKTGLINALYQKNAKNFFDSNKYIEKRYVMGFLNAHFSRNRHVRVLLTELVGNMLITQQDSPKELKDSLKVRKIINKQQRKHWSETIDLLSLTIEVLNAASYVADDAFDQTEERYGTQTVYKQFGTFAATIGADILVHHFGNYLFHQTIRTHERGAEQAYLTKTGSVSHEDPYLLKWHEKKKNTYVFVGPEQYMDVWEVWTWAWYMINSGQISDLQGFTVESYANRAYRLAGGFMETIGHLASAFAGCGYWAGRQTIGKWAAIYGTIQQVRNDFLDYVLYSTPGHSIVSTSFEDVCLGRVTLPFGYAYLHASKSDQRKMVSLAQELIGKSGSDEEDLRNDKIQLNRFIAKNGGFDATKRLVYNMVLWAVDELIKLQNDFEDNEHYWQLVAWTVASLNIVNIHPENDQIHEKAVKNFLDLNEVNKFLNRT